MKHIAIARRGDQVEIVQYTTDAQGMRVFELGGEYHFCSASELIRPVIINDLGHLVDVDASPRLLRRTLRREWAGVRARGCMLRYFVQIEEGWMELPLSNMADGLVQLWGVITQRAVMLTDDGKPVYNTKQLILSDGTAAPGIKTIRDDLAAIGLTGVQIQNVLELALETQRNGHSEAYVREQVIDRIVRVQDDPGVWPYVAAYVAYLGFEVGATTPLGGVYASGEGRAWAVLIVAGALGALWIVQRWWSRRR